MMFTQQYPEALITQFSSFYPVKTQLVIIIHVTLLIYLKNVNLIDSAPLLIHML